MFIMKATAKKNIHESGWIIINGLPFCKITQDWGFFWKRKPAYFYDNYGHSRVKTGTQKKLCL